MTCYKDIIRIIFLKKIFKEIKNKKIIIRRTKNLFNSIFYKLLNLKVPNNS